MEIWDNPQVFTTLEFADTFYLRNIEFGESRRIRRHCRIDALLRRMQAAGDEYRIHSESDGAGDVGPQRIADGENPVRIS